jgi:hypothetical protein
LILVLVLDTSRKPFAGNGCPPISFAVTYAPPECGTIPNAICEDFGVIELQVGSTILVMAWQRNGYR